MMAALAMAAVVSGQAGPCRQVRGRMDLWNGASTLRMWEVGTHRMLSIENPLDELPPPVRAIWNRSGDPDWRFSISIYGDYNVCAVSRSRPGWMQRVRVTDAHNLTVRPRPTETLR
jgi:hypothetical protein